MEECANDPLAGRQEARVGFKHGPKQTMKTVYVMGAGASRHAGYPLISDMGKRWLEWMVRYPDGLYLALAAQLIEEFGESPNIEDVVTKIESSIHSLEGSDVLQERLERMRLGTMRGELRQTLRDWFRESLSNQLPLMLNFLSE